MKKLLLVIGFLLLPAIAHAQNSSLWKFTGTLKPVVSSWRVDGPQGFSGASLVLTKLRACASLSTSALGMLQCAAGGGSSGTNSGNVLTLGDARYVKKSGDTMTGALTVNVTGGNPNTVGLKLLNALTGAVLHAERTLTSSGGLSVEGTGTGQNFFAQLSVSGTHLFALRSFNGAGLVDCSAALTSKLLWNSATKRFSCGTDTDTDQNTTYTAGQGLTLTVTSFKLSANHSGATIQASAVLASSGALIWEGTATGNVLHVEKNITASGSIIGEGAFSGATLKGFGLGSCSTAGTSKLLYSSTTNTFSCGTDSDTLYTAGQGLTKLATNAFQVNATLTGSTYRVSVALASSGTLVVDGLVGFKKTASGNVIHGEKGVTASGQIVTETSFSGASIFLQGLADCSNTTTSKVIYTVSTGKFTCATDQTGSSSAPEVGTLSFSGAVLRLGDARYLKLSGGTVTGALTINITGGNNATVGLKIINTASGAHIHGEKAVTSSGAITAEGSMSGANLYAKRSITGTDLFATKRISGGGLTACSTATTSKLLWAVATKQFSCGTDAVGTAGQGLTLTATSFKVNATLTGSTYRVSTALASSGTLVVDGNAGFKKTLSGANIHAEKTITSSGTMIAIGSVRSRATLSGSNLYVQGAGTTRFSNHTYTWPVTQGTVGQVLTNNGSDTLTWGTAGETDVIVLKNFTGSATINVSSAAEANYDMTMIPIAANSLAVGTSYEFTIRGTATLNSGNTHTLRLYIGSVNPVTFNTCTSTSTVCTWELTGWFETVAIGASGKIRYHFEGVGKGSTKFSQTDMTTTDVTLDTTVANQIRATGQIDGTNAAFNSKTYMTVIRRFN